MLYFSAVNLSASLLGKISKAAGKVLAECNFRLSKLVYRRVIGKIVHARKSGGPWVDAPPEFGPNKTLYNRMRSGR
jgi:hypothetical protein